MEKKHILIEESGFIGFMGVVCCLFFGVMMGLGLHEIETAEGGGYTGVFVLLSLSGVGIYMIYTYFNHYLKLYPNGEAIYSPYLGKRREFQYSDIASVEHRYMKLRTGIDLKITFRDTSGNILSTVDKNMKNYDQIYEWLYYRKEMEESQGISEHKIEIRPTRIVIFEKVGRSILGGFGVINMNMAGFFVYVIRERNNSLDVNDKVSVWIMVLVFLAGGIYLIYYAMKGYKRDYMKQLEESKKYIKI